MSIYTVKVEESLPTADGRASPYNWLTYEEVYETTVKIGSAIRSRGVNPGCGIYAVNCPEWIMAMEACNSQAISYVPLYDSLGANAVEFIINHAEASIVFAQESKIPAILSCLSRCTIISFGYISNTQRSEAEEHGVACFSSEEFVQMGSLDHKLPQKRKIDILSIMYTSGTIGEPKGVILTNGAFTGEVLSMHQLLVETDKGGACVLSFLPLAHIFDQIIWTYCIYRGASIGFWQGLRYIYSFFSELLIAFSNYKLDLLVLKPTIFRVMEKIEAGGTLNKLLFYKLRTMEKGLRQDEAGPRFDRLVFDKIKLAFGGRVRLMLSGAAPLPKHVEEFLRVTCCCSLAQGYGLTESCGGCLTSIANDYSMVGTSVLEMGYDALASVPRGDICPRGKRLSSGYHKQDLKKSVLVDGWIHTGNKYSGDVGGWQPDGAMKIIDRKKNNFKLCQGEFSSFLSNNTNARKYILDELNSTARKHQLQGFEMLHALHLEPNLFDTERDLVTSTFKLKRPQLLHYYKDIVGPLYKEANAKTA
ncbi:unnamed protein product [Withania somnifera]